MVLKIVKYGSKKNKNMGLKKIFFLNYALDL